MNKQNKIEWIPSKVLPDGRCWLLMSEGLELGRVSKHVHAIYAWPMDAHATSGF